MPKVPDYSTQFWQIQCPHCTAITYYHVTGFLESKSETSRFRRWPILRCRCGKYHSFLESHLGVLTTCERVPDNEVRTLVKRQAVDIELEVRRA